MRRNTKKIILEKATDLIYEHGFVKASIRAIVKAVNITNATVYEHFKNKDEILYTIIQDIGSLLSEELIAVTKMHDDPIICLQQMIYTQICLLKTKRKSIKIYIEEQYQLPRDLRKKATHQHREIYALYYNKICEIENKHPNGLLPIDKTVITFSIFAMLNWTYRWFNEKGPLSIEEVAGNTVKLLFHGIINKESLLYIVSAHIQPEM